MPTAQCQAPCASDLNPPLPPCIHVAPSIWHVSSCFAYIHLSTGIVSLEHRWCAAFLMPLLHFPDLISNISRAAAPQRPSQSGSASSECASGWCGNAGCASPAHSGLVRCGGRLCGGVRLHNQGRAAGGGGGWGVLAPARQCGPAGRHDWLVAVARSHFSRQP